jgi:hypothetical protein
MGSNTSEENIWPSTRAHHANHEETITRGVTAEHAARDVDAWPFYHVIEMWSRVFASQQYSMPMSQLGHSFHLALSRCPVCLQQQPNGGHSKKGRNVPPAGLRIAAKQLHSITFSARPRSGSGTLIPSALAAFRLMTSSTVVDC